MQLQCCTDGHYPAMADRPSQYNWPSTQVSHTDLKENYVKEKRHFNNNQKDQSSQLQHALCIDILMHVNLQYLTKCNFTNMYDVYTF